MPNPKIDRVKLNQMLKRGNLQKEIAQVFGVTESAISKAKKELNITVIKMGWCVRAGVVPPAC